MAAYDYHIWTCGHCRDGQYRAEGVRCPKHGAAGSNDTYFWECSKTTCQTVNDWNRSTCLGCGGTYVKPPGSDWS
jgi:hypothetical protein